MTNDRYFFQIGWKDKQLLIWLCEAFMTDSKENDCLRLYNVNTVSRKCEYGVLEITSDTKVLLSHESQTSDLTKDFCITRDFQNPILTFPHSQHWHCWKLQISDMKLEMKWDIFLKEIKFLSILVNVLTCDYIDLYKLAISQKNLWNWCWSKSMYSHVTTLTFTN